MFDDGHDAVDVVIVGVVDGDDVVAGYDLLLEHGGRGDHCYDGWDALSGDLSFG